MNSALLVGLTGGIGAGKSTVARFLAAHGARLVDGDAAARDAMDPRTVSGAALLPRIAELIGSGVIDSDGGLDRQAVAARIFTDPALLQQYNALVRPTVLAAVAARVTRESSGAGVVVHELPLLSRNTPPLPWTYDLIVTVEADEQVRVARLIADRGYDSAEARRRIQAQGAEEDRLAIADHVLRTDGDLDRTRTEAAALWLRLSAARPRPRRSPPAPG